MYFIQSTSNALNISDLPSWLQWVVILAPILLFGAALCNLFIAAFLYRFTRKKNNSDRNIKWFQELVYTPNKEIISAFFKNLYEFKNLIPSNADLSEEESITLINKLKEFRQSFFYDFVDLIKFIDLPTHKNIKSSVDDLIDQISISLTNDELKWNNPKTTQKEITQKVSHYRNLIISALFNYKG